MKNCIDNLLNGEPRAPHSTYRLQLHSRFRFPDAEAIVPYLKELGIGDLYASPIFEARPGSMHGYDVTRHDRLNPELGGAECFDELSRTLKANEMGLLLDIVPNHMGVGNDARWWQDVLRNGRASEFAEFFDIDWTPLKPDLQNKLLLPILGKQYGEELEAQNIQVHIEDGQVFISYFDHLMPVAPRMIPIIFPEEVLQDSGAPLSFRDLMKDLTHIPPHETTDPGLAAQRRAQLAEVLPRLSRELRSSEMQPVLNKALARINGVKGDPRSFDPLHALLEAQPYRLAYWRVSGEEINYRRFFDVNDLVGLRQENPSVFAETHCLVRELLGKHQLTGLRIDHTDGMFNPRQYLIRLQLLYLASQCAGPAATGPVGPNGIENEIRELVRGYDWVHSRGPLYCVVEKILEPREALPREWPVSGTSGYDFIYFVNQLFIQQKNEARFNKLYEDITGTKSNPDDIIYRSKLRVMQTSLSSEVYVLTNLLSRIAASDRSARDFTESILEEVIRETIACFPVYRTYIDDRGQYTEHDRAVVGQAISRAKRRNDSIDASAFDFLQQVLLLGGSTGAKTELEERQLYFALKFQQLTGPVMAKGVEDTSFYVYNRFVSCNEVGSSMKAFGISPEDFHASNADRLTHSPDAMLTLSTHDTKRSEDVRARLNVLSEIPLEWSSLVRRWQRANSRSRRTLPDGRIAPDPNEEYMLYQNIAGAWPWEFKDDSEKRDFIERIKQYSSKALSESKVNVSWLDPDPEYLKAVHGFLEDILYTNKRGKETRFVELLGSLLPLLKLFGALNSLCQTVLKLTSPGVPDFYQGTELWDLSLVDPDNRRPVDYEIRRSLLARLKQLADSEGQLAVCRYTCDNLAEGGIKLWASHRTLELRQRMPNIFRRGAYTPLEIQQDKQQHAVAFARAYENTSVITVVPRFACTLMRNRPQLPLGQVWGDARLSWPETLQRKFRNIFSGETITVPDTHTLRLQEVFANFPAAVLVSTE